MSLKFRKCLLTIALLTYFARDTSPAADQVLLQFNPAGLQGEVALHSNMGLPVSAMYPEFTVWRSTNLQTWEPLSGPINGHAGVSDEFRRVAVPLAGDRAFYRVVANIKLAPADRRVGDAVYGYGTEFARQLELTGQLSLSDFVSRYTLTNQYLSQVSFDPTTAEFWDQFNLDPAVHNATNSTDPRLTDFRLGTNEFAVFQTNGFVVSQRLGSYSFADVFYKVYSDDLPVFFSADAALHAWHRSYNAMLEEVEETALAPRLQSLLKAMADQLPALETEARGTALVNGVRDADFFLAVAQSLVNGTNDYGHFGQNVQILGVLAAIKDLRPATVEMFGTNRVVDFSQFQVRGHYDTSERLRRYFRAMMWCGLIDFRFSGFEFTFPTPVDNSLRELSDAVVMGLLMNRSGQFAAWAQFDRVVQSFVGAPDSMNFAQLSDLLAAANIHGPGDLANTAGLQNLQARIMAGQLGVQDIRSGYFWSPLTREQIKLPRSFAFMGQRFVLDGWAFSKVVFDDILWDDDGVQGFEDKVMRRVPSALDIAFSVLGNSQVVPDLAARISRTNLTLADGRAFFRDGLKYQHNLAALRKVVDSQGPDAWTNSIYSGWLACLRELSVPTTDPQYPQAMRTRAWSMKTLNTQLASWTQLRHDTVLYTKQPYTGRILCSYPDGYVEPRPGFWLKMKEMALRTRDLVGTLPKFGQFVFEPTDFWDTAFTDSLGSIWTNRVQFLDNFAGTMNMLQTISEKELARAPLATNEVVFIQSLVENQSASYSGVRTYTGWYPGLFYLTARGQRSVEQSGAFSPSDTWDALVTDVHTDPQEPLVSDPGSVLHEGVGNVHLLMIAVDCGPGDAAVYAGPVQSHYEFELGPATRQTDSEWKSGVGAGNLPAQPDWTREYLVPGP